MGMNRFQRFFREAFGLEIKHPKEEKMRFRRTSGFLWFSVVAALFAMYGCGGGGDSSSPAAPLTPTVTTSAAAPAIENATLVGEVNPRGLATQVWFEYGTASDLTGATSTSNNKKSAGDNTATVQIAYQVAGLSPWTDYYCRVVAESSAGPPVKGNIVPFKTKAPTPTVNTLPTDNNIGLTSAILYGEVNPNGLAADVTFEYSVFPDLSGAFPPIPVTTLPGGKGIIKVSYPLTGLTRDVTYYYRVVAKNAGILLPSNGNIRSFKTLPNPLPIAEAGSDNTVGPSPASGPILVTLNGSASYDLEGGTIASYAWEQVATPGVPTVTISNSPPPPPGRATFAAPTSVPYPGLDLNFKLTVGSSRGPYFGSDTTKVTVKWGFLDDFTTDTTACPCTPLSDGNPYTVTGYYYRNTGGYTVRVYATVTDWIAVEGEGMNYYPAYQLAEAKVSNNHGVVISHDLPTSDKGVFSMDFYPIRNFGEGAGFLVRLVQDANNYYELTNWYDDGTVFIGTPTIKKVVNGTVVNPQQAVFPNRYEQNGGAFPYPIKITFSPTQVTWDFDNTSYIFSDTNPILSGRSISVNKVTMDFFQQDAFIDNIRLVP